MPDQKLSEFSSAGIMKDDRKRTVSQGFNYKTGEGGRSEFTSLEDMDSYFQALIDEDYNDEI